jgi:hypothetical protein
VVENRVLSGKKSIDALMIFLLERFRLEEQYSKELKKIVKKAEEISEIGYRFVHHYHPHTCQTILFKAHKCVDQNFSISSYYDCNFH